METAVVPCEAEFSAFEAHFIRAIKQQQHQPLSDNGLPVHLLLSDVDSWGEHPTNQSNTSSAHLNQEGKLTVTVPDEWSRLVRLIAHSPLPVLSNKLMDRVEAEQGECRRATALLDQLVSATVDSENLRMPADVELTALLLEYIVKKKEYITSLRQSRRDVENVNKQAGKVLVLMKPHRAVSMDEEQ